MKLSKSSIVVAVIVMLIFVTSTACGASSKINNMNFKQAEINDVLRAIAEVADVNLISDQSVSGSITVHLRDITFKKALDLITQSKGLAYKWDGNTVVVATPERIESIYAKIITEIHKLEVPDKQQVRNIIGNLYQELNIQLDTNRNQLIIQGKEERVNEALTLVKKLENKPALIKEKSEEAAEKDKKAGETEAETKTEEEPPPLYTDSLEVRHAKIEDLASKLSKIYPQLNITVNPLTGVINLKGREEKVKAALAMASEYDKRAQTLSKFIQVDYVKLERVKTIVGSLYPQVSVQLNEPAKEVIVRGTRSQLEKAVNVIKKLNQPKKQVLIEARVEEISSDKARELGIRSADNLSTLRIDSFDSKITGVELTWPNYLKALERDGYAENLANPRLMTLNGEKAEMLIGDEIKIPITSEDGATTTETVRAGVTLNFTPWITKNNKIELEVNPEVSNLSWEYGTEVPGKSTTEMSTNLRLNDGETFVIGGLIQGSRSNTVNQIPILSQIPVLGNLFKRNNKNSSRTELIIFITPHIIEENLESVSGEEHLITDSYEEVQESVKKQTLAEAKTEDKSDKSEIMDADKTRKTGKDSAPSTKKEQTREPVKKKDILQEKDKKFESLSPEELGNILNKSRVKRASETLKGLPRHLYFMYEIDKGETIADVAEKYGLSLAVIRDHNDLDTGVKEGRLLSLPIPRSHLYRLKKGETITDVSQKFKIDVEHLLNLNDIEDRSEVSPESIIILPKNREDMEN